MTDIDVKVDRVMELGRAVDMVGVVDDLPQDTTYWLGRLGDFCSSPTKQYTKQRQRLQQTAQTKQKPFLDTYQKLENKSSEEAVKLIEQINEINEQLNTKLDGLLEVTEKIKMPDFKRTDFIAQEEVIRVYDVQEKTDKGETITKKVEIKIKKGQSLVPIMFYKLMGEYIKE